MTYYLNIVFFSILENNLRLILQIKYNLSFNINLTIILSFLFILKIIIIFEFYNLHINCLFPQILFNFVFIYFRLEINHIFFILIDFLL